MSLLANLKKVDDSEFGWLDADGVSWPSPADYLGIKILGFCGCGCPDEVLRFYRDVLRLIAEKCPDEVDWEDYYSVKRAKAAKLFHGDRAIEYAAYYVLDDKELIEHGGSVPGWLTARGESLLADLEGLNLDAGREGEAP